MGFDPIKMRKEREEKSKPQRDFEFTDAEKIHEAKLEKLRRIQTEKNEELDKMIQKS